MADSKSIFDSLVEDYPENKPQMMELEALQGCFYLLHSLYQFGQVSEYLRQVLQEYLSKVFLAQPRYLANIHADALQEDHHHG
jgi:hypothetical protein